MQIGEEKKEGNQYQDLSPPWQEEQSPTRRRSKARSPFPLRNQNTWLSSTHSRSKSGSSAFSEKSVTASAIKTSFIATIKAQSPLHTIRSTTLVRNISTSNTTSSGTALKMKQHNWNIVQRRTW